MLCQILYIIGNEVCEWFSFYGMCNILVQFLIILLLLQEIIVEGCVGEVKDIMYSFMIGVYFFLLFGGWLVDRFFGKYYIIFWFSLVYCVGYLCLVLFENSCEGFFFGLGLIVLGVGGIKLLVVLFMGDQFDQSNKYLVKIVFDVFYWIINFGLLFVLLLILLVLKNWGLQWVFGILGILMFIVIFVFWLGCKCYVLVLLLLKDLYLFVNVVCIVLIMCVVGQGCLGLVIVVFGLVLVVVLFGLVGLLGIVICLCLVLVLILVGIGGGIWLQFDCVCG